MLGRVYVLACIDEISADSLPSRHWGTAINHPDRSISLAIEPWPLVDKSNREAVGP